MSDVSDAQHGSSPPSLPIDKATEHAAQREHHGNQAYHDDDVDATRVANRLVPHYDADQMHLLKVDNELLFGTPRTLEEATQRASAWIAAHRPPESWLECGATHVKTRGLAMMRIVGEPSASAAMGTRLGGDDAEVVWDGLTVRWLTLLSSTIGVVGDATAELAADLRLVVSRLFDRRWHFAHLRCLARELHALAHDRIACWAWDTWISRRQHSMLGMVAVTLKTITLQLVAEGVLAQWAQAECPVALCRIYASQEATTWRSLHPCVFAGACPSLCARSSSRALAPSLVTTCAHCRYALDERRGRVRLDAGSEGKHVPTLQNRDRVLPRTYHSPSTRANDDCRRTAPRPRRRSRWARPGS